MNRREWLRSTGAFASLSFLGCEGLTKFDFVKVRDRAAREYRPLVIVVIPKEEADRKKLGMLVGKFLTDAWHVDLAPLASAEFVCATREQILDIEPGIAKHEQASLLVLTSPEFGREQPSLHELAHLDIDLRPSMLDLCFGRDPALEGRKLTEYERLGVHHHAISKFLRESIARSHPSLLEHQRRTAPSEWVRMLEAPGFEPGTLTDEPISALSALLFERMKSLSEADAAAIERALADSVRRRIVDRPPEGAVWFKRRGCGFVEEGKEAESPARLCGTGFIAPPTWRFLEFLTHS